MTPRDRLRIARVAIFAVLCGWGLLTGVSAGSKMQPDDWPFTQTATFVLAVLLLLSALLWISEGTRSLARTVGLSAAIYLFAFFAGHLVGSSESTGPVVPKGSNAGPRR
jgi:hydrogenase/urease accessory protein HupE